MSIRYIQSKKMFESKIGDEVVMLDIDSGFYFGLNAVASDIWILLQKPISEEEIVNELLVQYDVDPEICLAETRELLSKMIAHQIISVN